MTRIETVKLILVDVYNSAISNMAEGIQDLPLAPDIKAMVLNSFRVALEVHIHKLESGNVGVLFGMGTEGMLTQLGPEEFHELLEFARTAMEEAEEIRRREDFKRLEKKKKKEEDEEDETD